MLGPACPELLLQLGRKGGTSAGTQRWGRSTVRWRPCPMEVLAMGSTRIALFQVEAKIILVVGKFFLWQINVDIVLSAFPLSIGIIQIFCFIGYFDDPFPKCILK